jgi:diguanylate cyclase (GGDEF)-like protein
MHAAATTAAVVAVQSLVGGQVFFAQAALLMVMAIDGMQLRELVSHAGALRKLRRWLVAVSLAVLPALALATAWGYGHLLLAGLGAWAAVVIVITLRAWPQSQPRARWLVAGHVALGGGVAWLGWRSLDSEPDPAVPLAGLLTAWAAAGFLASMWRSRIFSETRVRVDARNTIDPLTGLSTPLIFYERVKGVRNLTRRYGHPSVLLLVHIENLDSLAAEFGEEVAQSAVLAAANRIRQGLRDGDVAARVSNSRIAVLAEGMSLAEGMANVASRILVAGLKEPLPMALAEFLHFRIVLALVPVNDTAPKAVLQRMAAKLDEQLMAPTERRIVAISAEELLG